MLCKAGMDSGVYVSRRRICSKTLQAKKKKETLVTEIASDLDTKQ